MAYCSSYAKWIYGEDKMKNYLLGVLASTLVGLCVGLSYGMEAPQIYHKYVPTVVQVKTDTGGGTGVVISKKGEVLTCAHVVNSTAAAVVIIPYPGEAFYTANVVKIDRIKDLALVQIKNSKKGWRYVKVKKVKVYVGQPVFSIGHPIGLTWSIANGIISGHQRFAFGAWRTQSTVVTVPGNSGGPLFDKKGRLVGLMQGTRTASVFSGFDGISFAISLDSILELLTTPKRYKIGDIK